MCSEAGYFNADFLVVCKGKLIEVEIKTSVQDLKRDFKKPKHQIYQRKGKVRNSAIPWIPYQFYFAVPLGLYKKVRKLIPENYGIMVITDSLNEDGEFTPHEKRLKIVRKGKVIYNSRIDNRIRNKMVWRMSSELSNIRKK